MIISGVEFPEQLILDQRAGRLVIFAGAGVSLDPPSSLPNFVELTEEVVSRKLKKYEKSQLDQVLGASKQAGVNVHRVTKLIVDREGSHPTVLHKSLLSLFPESTSVRVVTTNFDRHFSSAARELFAVPPEEFAAPALPLGNDFRGIVYLHGSLERDEQRLVLTDSDFGRAYLTEGWATRFLWSYSGNTRCFSSAIATTILSCTISRRVSPLRQSASGMRWYRRATQLAGILSISSLSPIQSTGKNIRP